MTLPDRLKKVRAEVGLSQRKMATAIGIATRTWQVYEEGGSVPGGNVIEALAKMGFNANWLLLGDGPIRRGEVTPAAASAQAAPDLECLPSDNLGLGESVELLAKIYTSGSKTLIRAIAANLNAFSEAIDNKALALNTSKKMEEMETRMLAMEQKIAELEAAPKKVANG